MIITDNKINTAKQNFKGINDPLFSSLNGVSKAADIFIRSQENLSSTRFIQDTATNWFPKAVFSRSKEDFAEMSFLEFLESAIFYFASPVLGEKLFRNTIFKKFQPKELRNVINEQIPKSLKEISKNTLLTNDIKKRAIATKAGIVLSCAIIPIAEYTLSFAKNLFTLKTFKKSNFNNIANLDKNKNEKEDKAQQERVEKSSKKQLKRALIYSGVSVGLGSLLAVSGHKSQKLQNLSKAILEPGKTLAQKLNKKGLINEKANNFLSSISFDFANNNGKLALSKGQLGLTAILGLFGYSKAASDRGKLDVYEVWTRVPLVVFYTIFGSELFEKAFIKSLNKKNIFPDLIKKDSSNKLFVPKREEISAIAKKLASEKNTNPKDEFKKLLNQKAVTSLVPYLFSLVFMGFILSLITRLWTQYRYNHLEKNKTNHQDTALISFNKNLPKAFKDFQK